MAQKKKLRISSKLRKALALKGCDYCLDLSKLVFAGIVLANALGAITDKAVGMTIGVVATIGLAVIGFVLYIFAKK